MTDAPQMSLRNNTALQRRLAARLGRVWLAEIDHFDNEDICVEEMMLVAEVLVSRNSASDRRVDGTSILYCRCAVTAGLPRRFRGGRGASRIRDADEPVDLPVRLADAAHRAEHR